jgi:hypothetical protein
MTLPVTYQAATETQALTFARERITHFQSGDFCNLGCPVTHPDAGRRLLRRMIGHYAMSSAPAMLTAAEMASEWDEADIALRELILEFTNRHEPLPAFLATHNARILAGYVPPCPRSRKKATNFLLDFFLVYLIVELTEKFGLKPRLGRQRDGAGCQEGEHGTKHNDLGQQFASHPFISLDRDLARGRSMANRPGTVTAVTSIAGHSCHAVANRPFLVPPQRRDLPGRPTPMSVVRSPSCWGAQHGIAIGPTVLRARHRRSGQASAFAAMTRGANKQ